MKIFAPVEHTQIIGGMPGVGFIHQRKTSNSKTKTNTSVLAKGPKLANNTLEHVRHRRMIQAKAEQQITNLEQFDSVIQEEREKGAQLSRSQLEQIKPQRSSLLLPTI